MDFIRPCKSTLAAPWGSGQAFGSLEPATAVRICPGLSGMKSVARLTLTFDDAASAEAVAAAVALDDEGYIRTTRRGRTLIAEASAEGPMGLLRTLDDYLACISVAERTPAEARPRGRVPRRRAWK